MDTLIAGARATHDVLAERLEQAASTDPERNDPRSRYPVTDTFLASASRHVNAAVGVLVPAARKRLPDGADRGQELVRQVRRLEAAMAQVKARLYGSTYAIGRTWSSVWDDTRAELAATRELEEALCRELDAHREPGDPDWTERLYHAELRAPTRPHPYVPHQGVGGRLARRVALRVDQFWDMAEGRMAPEPIRHHDRSHDGLITQYLLADPHFDDE
ncbi:hypothetical protein [Nocardioides jiangxiensis]|uniref:Uncharacterized protein n=1 Tax=Nocardioides jiangxiensis TaxID=3064524 RepID=A0ABT9B5X2_9ACTN|nr:hypothetical protein [Nocardioides sp. WY-20]MDO7868533.1 hypothetical protein [Nocardioides sp. WY-20]